MNDARRTAWQHGSQFVLIPFFIVHYGKIGRAHV